MPSECETVRAKKIVACVIQATNFVDSKGNDLLFETSFSKYVHSAGGDDFPFAIGFTNLEYSTFNNNSDNLTPETIDTSIAPLTSANERVRVITIPEEIKFLTVTVTAWQDTNPPPPGGIGPVRVQLFNPNWTPLKPPVVHDFGTANNIFPVTGYLTIPFTPSLPSNTSFLVGFQQDLGNNQQIYSVRITYN
jgi:hypothetical protein